MLLLNWRCRARCVRLCGRDLLVHAQQPGMAELSMHRPLDESHLDHDPRLHPVRPKARQANALRKGRLRDLDRIEAGTQIAEEPRIEAGADLAGEDEIRFRGTRNTFALSRAAAFAFRSMRRHAVVGR